MPKSSNKLTTDQLGRLIYEIRGERVMLESDLASSYGVETKALNRAVKRNRHRFPKDFVFQLRQDESELLRRQIGTLKPLGRGVTAHVAHPDSSIPAGDLRASISEEEPPRSALSAPCHDIPSTKT
jgi:hypothetical protein